jgi:two-component system LytT family sensor kinase
VARAFGGWGWLGRRHLGTEADRTTFRTLHTASLTTPALRGGLTTATAEKAGRHLRSLLGAPAIALTDTTDLLAWDGRFQHHSAQTGDLARYVVTEGATAVRSTSPCGDPTCGLRRVIVTPLTVEERVVGTLQVFAGSASAGLVRAADEVARWVSGQLELAELDASRTRLMEAEVRALRAQISPHFVYNSLTAIASFVRTDPERARELLLEFADFTRYSFRRHGEFTTLAEELGSI